MLKRLLHFLTGCTPSQLLWDGESVKVTGKKNHKGIFVKGFDIYSCAVCKEWVPVMKKGKQ